MKERVPKLPRVPMTDISKEWDKSSAVRDYLLENPKQALFHDNTTVTVKCASKEYIYDILKEILYRTALVDKQPQPPVRPLRAEIALLYQRNTREPVASEVIADSWYIRKFLTFIKCKVGKKLVSTVPHLELVSTTITVQTSCL